MAGPEINDSLSLCFVTLYQEIESNTHSPFRFHLDIEWIIGDNRKL